MRPRARPVALPREQHQPVPPRRPIPDRGALAGRRRQHRRGSRVSLAGDSGYFGFFSRTDVEVLLKALDACGTNNRFWLFAGDSRTDATGPSKRHLQLADEASRRDHVRTAEDREDVVDAFRVEGVEDHELQLQRNADMR